MHIRRAESADHSAIYRIHQQAFARNAGPGADPVEPGLVDTLRADGDLLAPLALVADVDGRPTGHVCCSRARLDDAPAPIVGLGPIGVLPDRQGAGVGSALMHAVIAAADALELAAIVLLGDPEYYVRFGFASAAEYGITPPVADWEPHFQVRTLHAYRPTLTGAFSYAPAFDGL